MSSFDNKRIAQNTVVLYVKLVLSVVIGLYTSRVVLLCLGASDYGLYTVVGGIVSMMNFLGTTMVSVSYRYIIVEFGKGENGNPNRVFNTVLVIHIILMLLLVVFGEIVGQYYILNIAKFDPVKLDDAIFVLHMSLFSTALSLISIPYNGLIIAREKFVFTAFVEIGRSILKLVFVIFLFYFIGNKLRLYSIIVASYSAILPISLFIYTFIKDKEIIKWKLNKNKKDYKDIFRYAMWIMIGALASMGQNQGSNMVINYFFNTVANAAFGIGFQINTYVMMFVQSLNQAAVPQIMKSQSANNEERSMFLVYYITKVAFFIMLLPTIPLILNMNYVLKIWLKEVPPYTEVFATLLLIGGLVRCMGAGFDSSIQATGKIKPFQIFYSIAYLSVLPLAYVLFKFDFPVYTILICTIFAAISVLVFQVQYLSKISTFSIRHYFSKTVIRCMFVAISSMPLYVFKIYTDGSLTWFVTSSIISLVWILFAIFTLGCTSSERMMFTNAIKNLRR
jgi:O-antigen/teichoic acid export membrane protein